MYGRMVAWVLTVLYAVGLAGHIASDPLEQFMAFLTPGVICLTGGLVILPSLATGGRRFAIWAAGTYAFTFLLEAAGVASGAVFGEYHYGTTLGWAWRGVPVVIAFNWLLVINGSICLARRVVPGLPVFLRQLVAALLTGLLAVLFDVILEPVAIRLGYWQWLGGAVPGQNYLAWFIIAAAAAVFHPRLWQPAPVAGCAGNLGWFYLVLQTGYFALLQLLWRLGAG